MMGLLHILLLLLAYLCSLTESAEKRLLLNDPNQMEREIQELRTLVASLTSSVNTLKTEVSVIKQSQGGAQFVRWGKSACPDDDTELVYEGFGAGGYYNSYGTGVNFLCLPRDPIFGSNYTGTSYAQVLGAEYDSDAAFFGTKNGDDLPCAVCRSHSSVTNMMLPGRNKCYQNWRKQYNGYLATSSSGSPASKDYICIDENPDALVAGGHNDNGALFYSVVAKCGALACPPYHEGSRLTCVVCTK